MKQFIKPTLGVAAFIIGGIVAREKALDIIETVEKSFSKKSAPKIEQ